MNSFCRAVAIGPALLVCATLCAVAAPPELYNKTVVLTWTVAQSLKTPDGRIVNPTTSETRSIYVSNAGRLFVRSSRTTDGQSRSADTAPGDKNRDDRNAQVSGWSFRGNTLAIMSALSGSGGARVAATFDAGFRSCSLSVTYGKAGGAPIRFKGIDGVTYEALSLSAANPACTIRDGNAFGN